MKNFKDFISEQYFLKFDQKKANKAMHHIYNAKKLIKQAQAEYEKSLPYFNEFEKLSITDKRHHFKDKFKKMIKELDKMVKKIHYKDKKME